MAASDAEAADRWLEDFARAAESTESLDRLVAVVTDRIVTALPEFLDPTLRPGLNASARGNWKGFLAVVASERIEVRPAPQVREWARTLARRGFELPVLLSSYRIAQRATWDFINDVLQEQVSDPALRSAVLVKFWSRASEWMDSTVETLIGMFSEEQALWQSSPLARQAAIVRAILAGQAVDLDSASSTLKYPLNQHHTAFAVRIDPTAPDADVHNMVRTAARSVSTWLGGGEPLVVPSGARSAWGWTATPFPAEVPAPPDAPGLATFVQVSVGNGHSGVSGFRLSHHEAVAALSVAAQGVSITRFPDVELACLVGGSLGDELRSAFVQRELGGLAAGDENSGRLRETLRAYLRNGGDAALTGTQLMLHPNGVRYRIRQAEKRMGHSIQQRRGHIEVALEIVSVLGIAPSTE